jgi:hypothetical protein
VEGDEELTCSWVTDTEKLLHDTLVSANWDILHLLRVSLKERKKEKACLCAPGSFEFPQLFPSSIL